MGTLKNPLADLCHDFNTQINTCLAKQDQADSYIIVWVTVNISAKLGE